MKTVKNIVKQVGHFFSHIFNVYIEARKLAAENRIKSHGW